MSPIEKQRVIDTVSGFSSEDMKVVLSIIPEALLWDELRERSDNKAGIINDITNRLMLNVEA